jgi:teichuronic acid exporter
MNNNSFKTKVISSLFWKLLERGGTQGIQLIVSIVLARLLQPADYGILALISVFISISTVFVETGFSSALIQKKDVDNTDYNSVFFLSLVVSSVLYAVIFFISPFIADFYEQPIVSPVLRVFSLTLIVGSFTSIQSAILYRNMLFKKYFIKSILAIILSGSLGIFMAYRGYGVWALVAQQLSNKIIICISMWFTVKWHPGTSISFERLKSLFKFGSNILASNLLNTVYDQLRALVIGKLYSIDMLAYYNKGEVFPSLIATNTDYALQGVMLTAYSKVQENHIELKTMVRRTIKTSSFFILPLMAGLAAIASPLVSILLTDKWLPSVPYMQLFCVVYAFQPIRTANLQALNGMGRSDIYLRLGLISKLVGIIVIIATAQINVYAIAIGAVFASLFATVINTIPNRKILEYNFKEQLTDILPSLLISSFMFISVYSISYLKLSALLALTIQIPLGCLIYIGLSWIFKVESFSYLRNLCKSYLMNRRK